MTYDWEATTDSWMLVLTAGGVGDKTRNDYLKTLTYFRRWLDVDHPGIAPDEVGKDHIRGWFAAMQSQPEETRLSTVTISNRYRHLQQWCRYLVEEAEIHDISPMYGMRPPKVNRKVVPVIDQDDLLRLVAVCEGKTFNQRRDLAIILMLVDTGVRREECSNIDVADVNLRRQNARIAGKGGTERYIPFGVATTLAIDKYKRVRALHSDADMSALWLSHQGGRLKPDGIHQMLKRRGREAGVQAVRAHRFRHTMAHNWLADGGNTVELMAIAGWETDQMIRRYTEALASERAAAAHKSYGLADKLLRREGGKGRRRPSSG